jgi:hypothetical protein
MNLKNTQRLLLMPVKSKALDQEDAPMTHQYPGATAAETG